MMVKNESKRILDSLGSVLGVVKSVCIYDTGSEDNTIELIRGFCSKNSLPLYLKEGVFEDFSTSRNTALDIAEEHHEIDYILMLDGNDELKGGEFILKAISVAQKSTISAKGFMVCQEWLNPNGTITKYYNIRLIKRGCNWRYKGSVHEYITCDDSNMVRLPDTIRLFQDRKYDVDKSSTRYTKDKELLLKDYNKDPEDARTLFYLAQTYGCLGENEEASIYYLKRTKVGGFVEEVFQSYLRLGELGTCLNKDWGYVIQQYLSAYNVLERAEPLVKIASYYNNQKEFFTSYMFCKKACELQYPEDAILFVDRKVYDYDRWHLLGIVSYYAGKYNEGYEGCRKAIKSMNLDIDKNNIKFYEEKLGMKKKKK